MIIATILKLRELENRRHHFQTTRSGKSSSFSNHKNWTFIVTIFKPQELENRRHHFHCQQREILSFFNFRF
jgi:hypothetical protein